MHKQCILMHATFPDLSMVLIHATSGTLHHLGSDNSPICNIKTNKNNFLCFFHKKETVSKSLNGKKFCALNIRVAKVKTFQNVIRSD